MANTSTLHSEVVGVLHQDSRIDTFYTSDSTLAVPLLDGQQLPCVFVIESDDDTFLSEADVSLHEFLKLSPEYKSVLVSLVYKNYLEYGFIEDDSEAISEEEIWSSITFTRLSLERRHSKDNVIYLTLQGECSWEEEHGIQVVFRKGKEITRVSQMDGHVTESSAYGTSDEEDLLLAVAQAKD